MSTRGKKTSNPGYIAGGHWVTCQRCDFVVRNWDIKVEWTGAIVCKECYEPRHSQDFVRGVPDDQRATFPVNPGLGGRHPWINLAQSEDTGLLEDSEINDAIADGTSPSPTLVALHYSDGSQSNLDGTADPEAPSQDFYEDSLFTDVTFNTPPSGFSWSDFRLVSPVPQGIQTTGSLADGVTTLAETTNGWTNANVNGFSLERLDIDDGAYTLVAGFKVTWRHYTGVFDDPGYTWTLATTETNSKTVDLTLTATDVDVIFLLVTIGDTTYYTAYDPR